MKRRSFLKLVGAALITPSLLTKAVINNPIAYTSEATIACNKLWAKHLFDYALQNMCFTNLMRMDTDTIIKIKE